MTVKRARKSVINKNLLSKSKFVSVIRHRIISPLRLKLKVAMATAAMVTFL